MRFIREARSTLSHIGNAVFTVVIYLRIIEARPVQTIIMTRPPDSFSLKIRTERIIINHANSVVKLNRIPQHRHISAYISPLEHINNPQRLFPEVTFVVKVLVKYAIFQWFRGFVVKLASFLWSNALDHP